MVSGHQSDTANSPGTIGRVRGSSPSRAHMADDAEDADEHHQLQRVARRVPPGTIFHSSHSTGCAIATAHTEP